MWLNQAVAKLVRFGHAMSVIQEYTIGQFTMILDAVEQIEAAERLNFVTDMSAVVGSLFADKDPPIVEHVERLQGVAHGETIDGHPS